MLYYALVALYVLISILLLVVVLLQQGKGGDMAAAFGGASSQTAFGARAGATVLTRATTILGTLFLLGAFGLTLMGRHGGGSVVSGVAAPAVPTQQTAPALPMPLATTPAAPTTNPPTPATPAPATPAPAPAK
ncbi:MAG: preprotein translocase subunit SecG [Acidobacteriota bacterium]